MEMTPTTYVYKTVDACQIIADVHRLAPTLLLHGDRDTDVLYTQSVCMAEALARDWIEHGLVTIPEGGHGFDSDQDHPPVRAAFARVMSFSDTHCQVARA